MAFPAAVVVAALLLGACTAAEPGIAGPGVTPSVVAPPAGTDVAPATTSPASSAHAAPTGATTRITTVTAGSPSTLTVTPTPDRPDPPSSTVPPSSSAPPTTAPATTSAEPTSTQPDDPDPTTAPDPDPAPAKPAIPDPPDNPADPWPPGVLVRSVDAEPLLDALTDALQAGDRAKFLTYFSGKALPRAEFWWDNLAAIGMDGGAVSTIDNYNAVEIDRKNTGTLFGVQAGAHFPGDDVDVDGRQVVATSSYVWKLKSIRNRLTVVDWVSLDQTPWDCSCNLYLAKGENGVVAAYPDEAAFADRILPGLDAAAAWNAEFFALAAPDLQPMGPVVAFATAKDKRLLQWFQSLVLTDPNFPGGVPAAAVHNLRGYSGDDPDLVTGDAFQGARIVIGDSALSWADAVLVHELVHYLFTRYDQDAGWLQENPYAVEGLAEMVQQVYLGTSPEDAAAGRWNIGDPFWAYDIHPDQIKKLFKDQLPSAEQLRSTDLTEVNFWYDVAATVYSYVAAKYGMEEAVSAGVCAYTGRPVFECVAQETGKIDAPALQRGWAKWVRKTYG